MVTVMHVTNKLAIAAVASLLAITACDRADPRIQNLTVGIPKDSVIAVMEGEAPKRIDPYLYNGQYIEAMLFPRQGKTDSAATADRNMTPVVVINGKLVGWGWDYWDSTAAANNIEVAPK